ncbi:MAG: ankyrin repeat domain-containing protein [Gemmatimonadaceae bacterium]
MIFGYTPAQRDAMRLLLEHGADPNVVDTLSGKTPIGTVSDPEILRALVDRGADIDRIQPDGVPAVVGLISTRAWESALYLIEKGANLDVVNQHGLSVDYYLNDWKESVFGEHPEGWDKVREAIAKRRAARNRSGASEQ